MTFMAQRISWYTIKQMLVFPPFSGRGGAAPLLIQMLHSVETEAQRYERIINYWPVYAPQLEGAICAVLRAVTGAITRQCGLLPSMHLHRPASSFGRTPVRYGTLLTHVMNGL